jgi:drug/metabolite transporter (DMT)-like permease
MPGDILAIVLVGAFLHAAWNAMIKASADKYLDSIGLSVGAALLCLPLALVLTPPAPASWPYLLASATIHIAYFALVAAAYRTGDMSRAYPLMRGTAPLIVTAFGVAVLGESVSPLGLAGIATLCAGILLLARVRAGDGASAGFALANASIIALYTIVDGFGARLSGNAIAYTIWLFVVSAILQTIAGMAVRGAGVVIEHFRRRLAIGIVGGGLSVASYAAALYAMQFAPVPIVAALRETSIVFGLLIAAFMLKEAISRWRMLSAGLAMVGVALLRVS